MELSRVYIIHRMIIDRSATRRGVGAMLLDHAERLARRDGHQMLILDAWMSNTSLHAYYEYQGFRHVRTVLGHSAPSAAVFARPVRTSVTA
ncbi:MAG: GNAT family N-acetyltransferase [Pseudonocardiaceae bacterium]